MQKKLTHSEPNNVKTENIVQNDPVTHATEAAQQGTNFLLKKSFQFFNERARLLNEL